MRGLIAAVLVAGALASSANARPSVLIGFQTPSHNIACMYAAGEGGPPSLRCDIRSGLRPAPPKPSGCDFDWGTALEMNRTGRAHVGCVSDTVLDPRVRVLAYGSTWKRGGFTCASATTGLHCTNASGHGFLLSRERWEIF
jgi:hypothetical protein